LRQETQVSRHTDSVAWIRENFAGSPDAPVRADEPRLQGLWERREVAQAIREAIDPFLPSERKQALADRALLIELAGGPHEAAELLAEVEMLGLEYVPQGAE
jgi:hypothetical protein